MVFSEQQDAVGETESTGLNGVEREFSLESRGVTQNWDHKKVSKWKALRVKHIAAYSVSQDEGSAVYC